MSPTMLSRRSALAFGGAALASTLLPQSALAGPASKLIAGPWQTFGTGSWDAGTWAQVLAQGWREGRDGVAAFDYGGADISRLAECITQIEATDPTTLSREAAFAFWANAYNIVTVDVVVRAYPVDTIRSIGGGLFTPGPWRDKLITVAGQALSLDDIEHGILRPVFGDARVHYAVNCASIGCPNLKPTPWVAATLDADLDRAARTFVNHPRAVQVRGSAATVSSIYHWFKEDFGNTDAGVLAHLRQYADPDTTARLAAVTRISGHDYDWSLNDA